MLQLQSIERFVIWALNQSMLWLGNLVVSDQEVSGSSLTHCPAQRSALSIALFVLRSVSILLFATHTRSLQFAVHRSNPLLPLRIILSKQASSTIFSLSYLA